MTDEAKGKGAEAALLCPQICGLKFKGKICSTERYCLGRVHEGKARSERRAKIAVPFEAYSRSRFSAKMKEKNQNRVVSSVEILIYPSERLACIYTTGPELKRHERR